MRKVAKSTKKGFTLVELIVVLVILAVLAAMLVPALTGYIRKAREEKEFQAAAEVLTASQALVTEYYGKTASPTKAGAEAVITDANVLGLTGVTCTITSKSVDDSTWTVNSLVVEINGGTYTWNGSQWNAPTSS
jgi:prepilin-type N-terminal cleavage/methylation domain-containing protein